MSSESPIILSKTQLRNQLRSIRKMLGADVHQAAASTIVEFLAELDVFKKAESVACYFAQGSELSLQPVMELIWQKQKKCYLPILNNDQSLGFVSYQPYDDLTLNRYGILEPVLTPDKVLAAEQLDLVLVPLVGFDKIGHRLGSGSGYYDRTFSFLCQHPKPTKPFLLGVGYQEQCCDHLPHDAWDVKLDAILTQQGVTFF